MKLKHLLPFRSWRKYFTPRPHSKIVPKYLAGLNGIEIGGSTENDFELDKTGGAYANIDFDATQGGKWQLNGIIAKLVNIVASGDNLPFKDNTLDYVFNSHVIEHFFDPIAAISEWLRVVKTAGYVFMIVPHKERTFDSERDITTTEELIKRHSGHLKISDYAHMSAEHKEQLGFVAKGTSTSDNPHILIKDNKLPEGYVRFKEDDHHHWCVWDTANFLELCEHMKLNIVEHHDVDDKIGNGFTVIIKK